MPTQPGTGPASVQCPVTGNTSPGARKSSSQCRGAGVPSACRWLSRHRASHHRPPGLSPTLTPQIISHHPLPCSLIFLRGFQIYVARPSEYDLTYQLCNFGQVPHSSLSWLPGLKNGGSGSLSWALMWIRYI